MKKLFKMALIFAAAMSVAACGGNKSEGDATEVEVEEEQVMTIEPSTTSIKGALGDYFTVVDRTYKLTKDGSFTILAVEVERNDTPTPFKADDICFFPNGKESAASMLGGFGYELIDENGDVINKGSASSSTTVYGWDDVEEALHSRPGETSTIRFSIYDIEGKPAEFRVTSDLQKNTKSKGSNVVEDTLDDIKKDAEESMKDVKNAIEAEKAALDLINSLYN